MNSDRDSQTESLLSEHEQEEEINQTTKISPLLVYWIFFVYGIAMLLPWNVFITASDFFSSRFATSAYEHNFQNYFSAFFNCSNLVSLSVFLWFNNSVKLDVMIPLLINLVIFVFYAISAISLWIPSFATSYFWLTIICIVLTGITTSMFQVIVLAEASQLLPKYMQGVLSGQGVSGVSVALFSFLLLASHQQSAFYYFVYAIFITILGIIGRCLLPPQRNKVQESIVMVDIHSAEDYQLGHNHLDIVMKVIPGYICTIIYIYIVTLSLFPSVTVLITPSSDKISPVMFTSLHFLIFNVGDWIGRTLPIWRFCQIFSSKRLLILALSRTIFIPLFLNLKTIFNSDMAFFIILLAFSISNGWLTSLVFMAAPKQNQLTLNDKSFIGSVMSFFLVVGLALGGLTSFLLS